MNGESPRWINLDLQAGPVPSGLRLPVPGNDGVPPVVVVMATESARAQGWAARASLHLAREWVGDGARIFLMDLNLAAPELHGYLGEENREGVSDVILFGASVPRVSRSVDDGRFYLATAGTAVADAGSVLGHERWFDVIRGFQEAAVTPVLYIPAELAAQADVVRTADVRVLLRGPWEGPVEEREGIPSPTVVAGAGPPEPDATSPEQHGAPGADVGNGVPGGDPDGAEELAVPDEVSPPPEPHFRPTLGEGSTLPGPPPNDGLAASEEPEGAGEVVVTDQIEDPFVDEDPSGTKTSAHPAGAAAAAEPAVPTTVPSPSAEARAVDAPKARPAGRVRRVVPWVLGILLVALLAALGADWLGYLDLSPVLPLPWHEAATSAFRTG